MLMQYQMAVQCNIKWLCDAISIGCVMQYQMAVLMQYQMAVLIQYQVRCNIKCDAISSVIQYQISHLLIGLVWFSFGLIQVSVSSGQC